MRKSQTCHILSTNTFQGWKMSLIKLEIIACSMTPPSPHYRYMRRPEVTQLPDYWFGLVAWWWSQQLGAACSLQPHFVTGPTTRQALALSICRGGGISVPVPVHQGRHFKSEADRRRHFKSTLFSIQLSEPTGEKKTKVLWPEADLRSLPALHARCWDAVG
jgi:hypothetical protein